MHKILVRNLNEDLELLEVGEGGGYFDDSRIIWDSRSGKTMPRRYSSPLKSADKRREKEAKDLEKKDEARLYLQATDWYIIRYLDVGKPIPEDVKTKRQEARDTISSLLGEENA